MPPSTPPEGSAPLERYASVGSAPTFAMRALLRTYADLQRHIATQLNLGQNDVVALEHLVRRPDLGPADVASLLGITTASATVLVDRLEAAGHVERRQHSRDRRRKQLVVTRHAQDVMFTALEPIFHMHEEIDEHYSAEEQAVIASYLQRVSDSYSEHVRGTQGEVPEPDRQSQSPVPHTS